MKSRSGIIAIGIVLLAAVKVPAETPEFKVVVHESNPATSITIDRLSQLFLRSVTTWPRGEVVVPVDQAPATAVRAAFSEKVHGRNVPAIKGFWQRQIFSGKAVPPVEQPGDAEVIAFVSANPGAIGYVSYGARLPDTVKVLTVKD
jgi:ABC-type phosphate transport system substrate-binding protein